MRDEARVMGGAGMGRCAPAFTLFELVVVLAIGVLLMAGLAIRSAGDAGMQRRVAGDRVLRWVESARREAVVRGRPVLLGIRPADGCGAADPACKAALFVMDGWPPVADRRVEADGLSCWWMLDRGVILNPVAGEGMVNAMGGDAVEVVDRSAGGRTVFVNAMVFDSCGRVVYPDGGLPVALRLASARWDPAQHCWLPVDGSGHDEDCIRIGRGGGRAVLLTR